MILGIVFYRLLGNRSDRIKITQPETEKAVEKVEDTRSNLIRLIAFIVLVIASQGIIQSMMAFIPLFLVDTFGITEASAAVFLSLIFFAGLGGAPLGGYISDRLGRIPVTLAVSLLIVPVIFLITIVPFGPGGTAIGALLVLFGLMMFIRMPVAEAYIIGKTPEKRRSTIMGIYYFTNMEVGAVFAPVMGLLIDKQGFDTSFTIAAAAMLAVTVICSVFLIGKRN
jgi:predicted MFS family arabinose efflux permease